MMSEAEEFGARVRREILFAFGEDKEGWFADRIGVSRNQLSRMLNGKIGVRPEPETIKKIADGLGRNPWEVMAWAVAEILGPLPGADPDEERHPLQDVFTILEADPDVGATLIEIRRTQTTHMYREAIENLADAWRMNGHLMVKTWKAVWQARLTQDQEFHALAESGKEVPRPIS